ncbi:Protocadherin-1 isoform 2 [Schistosoma japonicum]|uniref:Protocadherin-1 isoform 2 n=1 Tax=Schistosoma japonicum TaxID=6182 RepID=A0A4Z2DLK1_SCHJA|nr:Protocadherin-1 isoform 2 [Schistosoma japonicum]
MKLRMWLEENLHRHCFQILICITYLINSCYNRVLYPVLLDTNEITSIQSNITQPYQVLLTIKESSILNSEVINISRIMQDYGILLETSTEEAEKRSSSKIMNFEILDISANLLTAYQQRNQNNLLNIIDLHPVKGIIKFSIPLDRERICNDLQNTNKQCRITLLIAAYKIINHGVNQQELVKSNEIETSNTIDYIKHKSELICIELIITLLDINDNSPYFPQIPGTDNHPKIITIEEECPIGTMVSLPVAKDMDSTENGIVKYELHPVSMPAELMQLFEIVQLRGSRIQCEDMSRNEIHGFNYTYFSNEEMNKDLFPIIPCLKIIGRLDREQMSRCALRLLAIDSGGRKGETVVRIIIRDINDHAPLWPDKLETELSPSSLLFMGSERITFQPKEIIEDNGNGRIIVKYTFQVPECINQRQLLRLNANDLDESESDNGRITYHLNDQTQDFEQLRQRLFISGDHIYLTDLGLKDLNQANLTIIVTATDGAGKSSDAWIHLLVQDCNDHKPMILMRNTEFSVVENAIGKQQLISLITVRDLDLTSSPNSEFYCSLNDTTYLKLYEAMSGPKLSDQRYEENILSTINTHNGFHSHRYDVHDVKNSGILRQGRWVVYRLETKNSSSFDRETTPYYSVMLQCSDKGSPMLTSNRLITINILDVNDNAPVFIMSNQPQSSHLFSVNPENHRKLFYQSIISSSSIGQKADQSFVYHFNLPENSLRGTIVGSVHAIDLDAGDNGRVTFKLKHQIPFYATKPVSLSTQNHSKTDEDHHIVNDDKRSDGRNEELTDLNHVFNLAPNGDIQLIDELDRETIDRYELHIVVSDNAKINRLSSTATVIIKVEDVNDCRPEFPGDYVFEIVESYGSSTIHQILGSVVATDMDLGRNGSITYQIGTEQDNRNNYANNNNLKESKQHSSTHAFASRLIQISHDGKLTVYGVIDREKTPVIILTVIAEDNGIPIKLSNSVTVTIHVLDLNDNKPRFIESSSSHSQSINKDGIGKSNSDNPRINIVLPTSGFKLNLSLDTNVGTLLTVFEAHDPDSGPNGTVVFDMAYSGTLGLSNEAKGLKSGNTDEENPDMPTFSLQPDGRLLLSKRLVYSDMLSPTSNSPPKRYRRPDRLLIRVSDKGPTPEHSITSLQIFYYDPIDTMHNTYSKNYFHVVNGQNDVSNDNEYALTHQSKESIKSKQYAYKSNRQAFLGQNGGDKLSSQSYIRSELTHSKPFTLPAMYLLALAVCLALILVIISFICFYVKLRRTNLTNSEQEKYDTVAKSDSYISCKKNNNGDIRLDNTLTSHSKNDESQTNTGSRTKIMSDFGISTLNCRSLSPTYIVRAYDHLNIVPSNDPYTSTIMSIPHRTADCSDYTPLSISQINSLQNSCLSSSTLQNDLNKQLINNSNNNNNNNNQRLSENAYLFKTCDSIYDDQTSPMLFNQLELCKTMNRQKQYNTLSSHQVEVINPNMKNLDNDVRNNDKILQTSATDSISTCFDSKYQNNKSMLMPLDNKPIDITSDNKHANKQNELISVSKLSPMSSPSNCNNNNTNRDILSAIQKSKLKLFSTKKNESHTNNNNQLKSGDSQVVVDMHQININKLNNSNDLTQLTSSFV